MPYTHHAFALAFTTVVLVGCASAPEQPILPPPDLAAPVEEPEAQTLTGTFTGTEAQAELAEQVPAKDTLAEPTQEAQKVATKASPVEQNTKSQAKSKPAPKPVTKSKPKATPKPKPKAKPTPAPKPTPKPSPKPTPKPKPSTAPVTEAIEPVVPATAGDIDASAQVDSLPKATSSLLSDLDQLPLEIGAGWTLSRDMRGSQGCVLNYRPLVMFDGHNDTKVNFTVLPDKIVFKTQSNIDSSYADSGIKVDEGERLPIEKLDDETAIAYTENYDNLIKTFSSGKSVQLALGFWPTWPVTQTYSLNIEISEFEVAYRALTACVALEQQLR